MNSLLYTNICSSVKMAATDQAIAELHAAGVETDGVAENARWRYTHFRMPDGKLYEFVEER